MIKGPGGFDGAPCSFETGCQMTGCVSFRVLWRKAWKHPDLSSGQKGLQPGADFPLRVGVEKDRQVNGRQPKGGNPFGFLGVEKVPTVSFIVDDLPDIGLEKADARPSAYQDDVRCVSQGTEGRHEHEGVTEGGRPDDEQMHPYPFLKSDWFKSHMAPAIGRSNALKGRDMKSAKAGFILLTSRDKYAYFFFISHSESFNVS